MGRGLQLAQDVGVGWIAVAGISAVASGARWPAWGILWARYSEMFGRIEGVTQAEVNQLSIMFLGLACLSFLVSYLQNVAWRQIGLKVSELVRSRFVADALAQDVTFFEAHASGNTLLSHAISDAAAVQLGAGEKMGRLLQYSATFVFSFGVAFVRGWDLTLVMVGCIPFLAGSSICILRLHKSMSNRLQDVSAKAQGVALVAIQHIRFAAAYNLQSKIMVDFQAALDEASKVGVVQGLLLGSSIGAFHCALYAAQGTALIYGMWGITTGRYRGGEVVNVLIATLIGAAAAGKALDASRCVLEAKAAITRMQEAVSGGTTLQVVTTDKHPPQPSKEALIHGSVTFQAVCFAYPSNLDVPVLRSFNFEVAAQATVGIVGGSGSGKSTVLQLILGLYFPTLGKVLIDGVDIRRRDLQLMRTQMALVSQDPVMFTTSIFDNIAMGKPGASVEEVHAAAVAANAHEFITGLPAGYQTCAGEKGWQMSGGQKQRIALARALLRQPKVLLLDEATSALDTQSEQIIQQALDRLVWQAAMTTIVVAHRLNTVRLADCIAVVEAGRLVEQGSHDQLMQRPGGAYRRLHSVYQQTLPTSEDMAQLQQGPQQYDAAAVDVVFSNPLFDDEEDTATMGNLSTCSLQSYLTTKYANTRRLQEFKWLEGGDDPLDKGPLGFCRPPSRGRRSPQPWSHEARLPLLEPRPGGRKPAINPHYYFSALSTADFSDISQVVPDQSAAAPATEKPAQQHDALALHAGEDGQPAPAAERPSVRDVVALYERRDLWLGGMLGFVAACTVGLVAPADGYILATSIISFFTEDKDDVLQVGAKYAALYYAIAPITLAAYAAMLYSFARMAHGLARNLRKLALASVLTQEVAWFDSAEGRTSSVISCLMEDTAKARGAIADVAATLTTDLVCVVAAYLIAFIHCWRLTLVLTGSLPLEVLAYYMHSRLGAPKSGEQSSDAMHATQVLVDAFGNVKTIKAYSLEASMMTLYGEYAQKAAKESICNTHKAGIAAGYGDFFTIALVALLTWFSYFEIQRGVAFKDVLTAYVCITTAAFAIAYAHSAFPDISGAWPALARVFQLIRGKTRVLEGADTLGLPLKVQGHIELREVVFAYPSRPSVLVLQGLTLDVPANMVTALVGTSGCGKSTIVSLIERFYQPSSGQVLLDGRDISTLPLHWLRSQLALVTQDPVIFSGSIADNIRFGREEATDEEVARAAAAANVMEFADTLPEGLGTLMGEMELQLSRGQQQRVAIARALLRPSKVLLLDEATSALDAVSEKLVQQAIDRLVEDRTCIVIAHRLSTIRNAGSIAVLSGGRVRQQGTHAELASAPEGLYSLLMQAQTI